MFRAAMRNLVAHRLRLVLTVLAIALGVAFVSGTLVFTTSMNTSLERFFGQEPADVVVTPAVAVQAAQGLNPTMEESIVERIAGVEGVARAVPAINQPGTQILDAAGQVVGGSTAVTVGASWSQDQASENVTLVAGRRPTADNEVAFDVSTAAKVPAEVGDTVRILTPLSPDPDKGWIVTAIIDLGLPGGATVSVFDFQVAQRYLVGEDLITAVNVTADDAVTQDELARAIEAEIGGDSYTVATGRETAAQAQDQVAEALGFLNTFLLVFALIAVFVAGFLIFNTFSMLVAQRTKELALLRAIGASRDQVRLSVIGESLVLGLVASAIGIGLGLLLARALGGLFAAFDIELPRGDLALTPTIIAIALAVGLGVTLLAAIIPASRASRIAPIAAMRDDVTTSGRATRERLTVGLLLAAAAVAFAVIGVTSENADYGVAWVGLSALLGIVAAVVLSAFLARPFLRLLGLPLRGGTVGRMAVLNSERNPRRTAATASALTIGVALMTVMSVFASSASATADDSIDRAIGADFVISDPTFLPMSSDVVDRLRQVDSLSAVSYVQSTAAAKGQQQTSLFAVEPDGLPSMVNLPFVEGSLESLAEGSVAVDTQLARQFGLRVGDTTTFTFPGGEREVGVGGIFQPAALIEGVLAAPATAAGFGMPDGVTAVYALAGAAGPDAARAGITAALSDYPLLRVQDQSALKEDFRSQINQLLAFVFVLLGLAVLIAMLGIVNTMQMSVVERTRELGMLRAIGAARPQVRRMIVLEALLLGAFGAVLGVALGLLYGAVLQRVMVPLGLERLDVPWLLLALFVLAGAAGGVLAALWPAVRGSRLNILQAIATS